MAFNKNTISLSLAILATIFILSTSTSINPLCDTANNKALCTELVKGAHKWADAMTNALNAAMDKAKAGKHIIDGIRSELPTGLKPVTKQSIVQDCNDAYEEDLIGNIKLCLGFVKYDPTSDLKRYLGATTLAICTDGLNEFGVKLTDVEKFANEIVELVAVLYAVAGKKP